MAVKDVWVQIWKRIVLALAFGVLASTAADAAWWDNNWQHRINITVGTSAADTNFPIKVVVAMPATMESDWRSVRFVNSSGVSIPFYRHGTNATFGVFFVNMPFLSTVDTQTLSMYYNNTAAADTSNGFNTFTAYDNFDGASLNTTIWTNKSYIGKVTVANGKLNLSCATQCDWWSGGQQAAPRIYFLNPLNTTTFEILVNSTQDHISKDGEGYGPFLANDPTVSDSSLRLAYLGKYWDNTYDQTYRIQSSLPSGGVQNATGVLLNQTWFDYIYLGSHQLTGYIGSNDNPYSSKLNVRTVNNSYRYSYAGLMLKTFTADGQRTVLMDDFILKKYMATEPTTTFGSEEDITQCGLSATGDDSYSTAGECIINTAYTKTNGNYFVKFGAVVIVDGVTLKIPSGHSFGVEGTGSKLIVRNGGKICGGSSCG